MDLQSLVLKIKGDSSSAEAALGKVQGAASKFGGVVKTVIAGAAVAAVVAFGKGCIDAAAEAQQGEVMLRSSLGNVKGMTDKAKDSAVDWVNSMEKSKSFDDADISAALQRIVVKTGNLKTSEDYLSVAMEVARNKNMDLASATNLLDTAYNGSAKALKQFGIEAVTGATGMDYLDQIQAKVKGSGDAWSKTLAGQREQFKTTFGNFQEAVGGFLMPIATKFMEVIQPFLQKGMSWIADHLPSIQAVIDTLVKGIAWVVETAGKMYEAIKPFVVSITETLGPYIKDLFTWLGGPGTELQDVFVGAARLIGQIWTINAAIIKGVIDSIMWAIEKAKEAIAWLGRVANAGVADNQFSGVASGTWTPPPHAAGGWVGLSGPEVALVGEQGPEYITSNKDLGGNDALLRKLIDRIDTLILIESRAPAMFGSVVNGLGRG